jgi:hypothetical protein
MSISASPKNTPPSLSYVSEPRSIIIGSAKCLDHTKDRKDIVYMKCKSKQNASSFCQSHTHYFDEFVVSWSCKWFGKNVSYSCPHPYRFAFKFAPTYR